MAILCRHYRIAASNDAARSRHALQSTSVGHGHAPAAVQALVSRYALPIEPVAAAISRQCRHPVSRHAPPLELRSGGYQPPVQALPYSTSAPPLVIARSAATWQSRAGTTELSHLTMEQSLESLYDQLSNASDSSRPGLRRIVKSIAHILEKTSSLRPR